jgi:hypothetical protein
MATKETNGLGLKLSLVISCAQIEPSKFKNVLELFNVRC